MPGYHGATPCRDLARFIGALNLALDEAGVAPVPIADPLSAPVTQGACRLDQPETATALLSYRRLFRHHRLDPPPAFAHFVVE